MEEFKGFSGGLRVAYGGDGTKYVLFDEGFYHLQLNVNWLTDLKDCLENTINNIEGVKQHANYLDNERYDMAMNTSYSDNKKTRKKGFVYLMKDTSNGYFKIGYSKDAEYREQTLQAEKPTIKLIWKTKGTYKNENELHKLFAHCRLRGEWFELTETDIELIKNYTFKN